MKDFFLIQGRLTDTWGPSLLMAAQGPVQGKVISNCCTATMQKLEKQTMEGETFSCR